MNFVADLVVASAGDDKKISLWRKNGESIGTVPLSGSEAGGDLEVHCTSLCMYLLDDELMRLNSCSWCCCLLLHFGKA